MDHAYGWVEWPHLVPALRFSDVTLLDGKGLANDKNELIRTDSITMTPVLVHARCLRVDQIHHIAEVSVNRLGGEMGATPPVSVPRRASAPLSQMVPVFAPTPYITRKNLTHHATTFTHDVTPTPVPAARERQVTILVWAEDCGGDREREEEEETVECNDNRSFEHADVLGHTGRRFCDGDLGDLWEALHSSENWTATQYKNTTTVFGVITANVSERRREELAQQLAGLSPHADGISGQPPRLRVIRYHAPLSSPRPPSYAEVMNWGACVTTGRCTTEVDDYDGDDDTYRIGEGVKGGKESETETRKTTTETDGDGQFADMIVFMKPGVIPLRGWLSGLLQAHDRNASAKELTPGLGPGPDLVIADDDTPAAGVVGSLLIYPTGSIYSAGLEYKDIPVGHATTVALPVNMLRGRDRRDASIYGKSHLEVMGVSRLSLMIRAALFEEIGGFDGSVSGAYQDADLCLRVKAHVAVSNTTNTSLWEQGSGQGQGWPNLVLVAPRSVVVALDPESQPELDQALASAPSATGGHHDVNSELRSSSALFSARWTKHLRHHLESQYTTHAGLSAGDAGPVGVKAAWVMQCGGSQGLEAATIAQELESKVSLRAIVRRYQDCEHTDTLKDLPVSFRDTLDRLVHKSAVNNDAAPESGTDLLVSIYSRDFRELGRWVPQDSAYVVGRY